MEFRFASIAIEDLISIAALPIVFVFFSALAEMVLAASRGLAEEGRSIRVRYRDSQSRLKELTTEPSTLIDFAGSHKDAVEILAVEKLATLNWWDYPSIPTELCFSALGTDAVAFFSPRIGEVIAAYKWLFPLHVFSLLAVVLLGILSDKTDETSEKRRLQGWSLFIAFTTAFLAFAALWSAL